MRRHLAPDVSINLNVRGLSVSATLAIQELSNKLRAEGRQVGVDGERRQRRQAGKHENQDGVG